MSKLPMTVQELIDELNEIENKEALVGAYETNDMLFGVQYNKKDNFVYLFLDED